MINWFLCGWLFSQPKPKPQPPEKLPPLYFSEAAQPCTGTCQTEELPTSYQTPPSPTFCKNSRSDGPTPCWYPSCVINEKAHGLEIQDGW